MRATMEAGMLPVAEAVGWFDEGDRIDESNGPSVST